MGDDIIANGQPVRLLDTWDNPYGVQNNPLVVQFNGSVGTVSVSGTVPVSVPDITVNGTVHAITTPAGTQNVQIVGQPVVVTVANPTSGTVAISTSPVPVSFTQPVQVTVSGTQDVVIRQQPTAVTGTVTAITSSAGTQSVLVRGQPVTVNGTVAISTSPVPVSFDASGTLNTVIRQQPVTVNGTVVAITSSAGTQSVILREQPIGVTIAGTNNIPVGVVLRDGTNREKGVVGNPVYVVDAAGGAAAGVGGYAGIVHAQMTTSTGAEQILGTGVFNEMSTPGQRSIVSASANDAGGGTGVRTACIVYFTQSGTGAVAGPFSETLTLNGLTAVNTVATDIRYVEKVYACTAGSGGKAAGNISVYSGTGGTGTIMIQIPLGYRESQIAHHYVPTGNRWGLGSFVGSAGIATNKYGLFNVRYHPLDVSDAADRIYLVGCQVSGYTFQYSFSKDGTPEISGPIHIQIFYETNNTSSHIVSGNMAWTEVYT
jgi:hypothetical protein